MRCFRSHKHTRALTTLTEHRTHQRATGQVLVCCFLPMSHWLQTHKDEKKSAEAWSDSLCITVFFKQRLPSVFFSNCHLTHINPKGHGWSKTVPAFQHADTGGLFLYVCSRRALFYWGEGPQDKNKSHSNSSPLVNILIWFWPRSLTGILNSSVQ